MRIWRDPFLYIVAIGLILPLMMTDSYSRGILILFEIYALFALSLNILIGYLGLHSFGHGAFFGLGAYCSGLLMAHFQWPFWLTWPAAALINGVLGALIGSLSLRLRHIYFAIVTLGFAELFRLIVANWDSLTRGTMGLTVSRLNFGAAPENYSFIYYYVLFVILIAALYFLRQMLSANLGRSFVALLENEELAKGVGISPLPHKVIGFTLSTSIAGLAGAAYAHYFQMITPELLGLEYTTIAILMVVVGGAGTLYGPLLGAGIFSFVPEILRHAEGSWRMVIFAVLLLLIMIFMPKGLIELFRSLSSRLPKRLTESGAAEKGGR